MQVSLLLISFIVSLNFVFRVGQAENEWQEKEQIKGDQKGEKWVKGEGERLKGEGKRKEEGEEKREGKWEEKEEDEYRIKVGTLAPEHSAWVKELKEIADRIYNSTKGRVKFIIYSNGVMGDEWEMIQKIKMGQLHAGAFTINGLKKIAPEIGAFDLPFLFRNYQEVDHITAKLSGEIERIFKNHGFHILLLSEQGFIYFFSKKDIKSYKDIANTRTWVWMGEPTSQEIVRIIGSPAVLLKVPDVFKAIDNEFIETFPTSPLACLTLQWCKLVRVMLNYPHRYEIAALVIPSSKFESIPEELRNSIIYEFKSYTDISKKRIREEQERAIDAIKFLGVKVIRPDDIQWFEEKTKTVWTKFEESSETAKELMKALKRELESFRQEIKTTTTKE